MDVQEVGELLGAGGRMVGREWTGELASLQAGDGVCHRGQAAEGGHRANHFGAPETILELRNGGVPDLGCSGQAEISLVQIFPNPN